MPTKTKSRSSTDDEPVVLLTLSDYNDRWNKIALGISDGDVPSRPVQDPQERTKLDNSNDNVTRR